MPWTERQYNIHIKLDQDIIVTGNFSTQEKAKQYFLDNPEEFVIKLPWEKAITETKLVGEQSMPDAVANTNNCILIDKTGKFTAPNPNTKIKKYLMSESEVITTVGENSFNTMYCDKEVDGPALFVMGTPELQDNPIKIPDVLKYAAGVANVNVQFMLYVQRGQSVRIWKNEGWKQFFIDTEGESMKKYLAFLKNPLIVDGDPVVDGLVSIYRIVPQKEEKVEE